MIVFSAIGNFFGKVIDKAFPDKTEAEKIKGQIQNALLTFSTTELNAAAKVLHAEISGESWLQRNWRPLVMLTFTGLVVAHWLGFTASNLREQEIIKLLEIVQIGLGGYVIGRSVEKGIKSWKEK